MTPRLRLGINIDHVATVRNARGGAVPDPVRAAALAIAAGADGITAHLREDRRHIKDDDIERLRAEIAAPLNMEMAATPEMVGIALGLKPHACCLVPEKREERTTEGGLNVLSAGPFLAEAVARPWGRAASGCRCFVEPDPRVLDAAKALGAPVVELPTGAYCDASGSARAAELERPARRRPGTPPRSGWSATPDTAWPSTPSARWRRCRKSANSTSDIS
jgi:pyridoxine 5-phosphate synthase